MLDIICCLEMLLYLCNSNIRTHISSRVSEIMDPSKFNTKVYVFHVKEVGEKDWDATDLIYGLCREDQRLNHTRFKNLARLNG